VREQTKDDINLTQEDRILFHEDYIKWYATKLVGKGGFADVDAHESLLDLAERLNDDYETSENNTEGIRSLGVFMRLGEDEDDFQRRVWGDSGYGMPAWYDLVDCSRSLTVGWE
jgi:hypothetical protein